LVKANLLKSHRLSIPHIATNELHIVGYIVGFHPVDVDGGHQSVEDLDFVTSFQQRIYRMGADKARSAGDQSFHEFSMKPESASKR
jgi:hypothetical protein